MKIKKFQEGGMAPEMDPAMAQGAPMGPEAAPAPMEGGEDAIMQIAQVAAQALQAQDCEAAMAVCEAFIQLIQQAGAPEGGAAPVEEAPQGEPVFKKGGRICKRSKKNC